MKARRAALAACFGVLLLAPAPLRAQQFKKAKKQELERVLEELDKKRAEIQEYEKEESELQNDLSHLEDDRGKSRSKLRRLQRLLAASQSGEGDLKQQAESLESAVGGWRVLLADGLRAYSLRSELDSAYYGGDDLWSRVLLEAATQAQTRYLLGLQGMQASTERATEAIKEREQTLSASSAAEQAKAQQEAALVEAKRSSLESTQALREKASQRMQELEETAQALNSLLKSLEQPSGAPQPPRLTGLVAHSLPWPAEGKLAGIFGKEKVPELDTYVIRQGIRIALSEGTPVRAVAPGKIVYAGLFRRYGNIIIVDHGGGFFTVYGYLREAARAKGESVDVGDVIAASGAPGEGAADEPAGRGLLYFEVRQNGEALDPQDWLIKK